MCGRMYSETDVILFAENEILKLILGIIRERANCR